jgi:hypothetical protein
MPPVPAVQGEVGGRLKAHLEAATAGDREMMLKQIESLKAARQEAEHLRQEVHRLTNELAAQVGVTTGLTVEDVARRKHVWCPAEEYRKHGSMKVCRV